MKNVDEEILKQRAKIEEFERERFSEETVEEEVKQSIFQGTIPVNKIPVAFGEKTLPDGKVAIWMPEDFEVISQEAIEAIYLLGNKPQNQRPDSEEWSNIVVYDEWDSIKKRLDR